MEPKKHEVSAEMRGDGRRVLDALVTALASSGFRVERRTTSEVALTGPEELRSHHSPIVGVSRIVARASTRRLAITAELGGVDKFRRMLLLIPLLIGVGLAVAFGIAFQFGARQKTAESQWVFLAPLTAVILVPAFIAFVVRPFAASMFEKKSKAALEALVTSVATIGADG